MRLREDITMHPYVLVIYTEVPWWSYFRRTFGETEELLAALLGGCLSNVRLKSSQIAKTQVATVSLKRRFEIIFSGTIHKYLFKIYFLNSTVEHPSNSLLID